MFLTCPACLHARREVARLTGFRCQRCGHEWVAPAANFSGAYYCPLDDLEIFLLADDGAKLRLTQFPVDIGRDSDFLPLQNNVAVSRKHCRIERGDAAGSFRVVDLESRGGTFVNTIFVDNARISSPE